MKPLAPLATRIEACMSTYRAALSAGNRPAASLAWGQMVGYADLEAKGAGRESEATAVDYCLSEMGDSINEPANWV